jgi:hypothetical protein
MSNDVTPRLSLPFVAAGQAQKHITVNEALGKLDGLVQLAVRAVRSPPSRPRPRRGDAHPADRRDRRRLVRQGRRPAGPSR